MSIWKTFRIFLVEIYHCISFSIGVGDIVVGVGVGIGVGVGVSVGVGVAFASCKALISYKFFYEYLLFEM